MLEGEGLFERGGLNRGFTVNNRMDVASGCICVKPGE